MVSLAAHLSAREGGHHHRCLPEQDRGSKERESQQTHRGPWVLLLHQRGLASDRIWEFPKGRHFTRNVMGGGGDTAQTPLDALLN